MFDSTRISGLISYPIKFIPSQLGDVMHVMRKDSEAYMDIGEVYVSEVLPGVVKAWKQHQRQTQNFTVPAGLLRLVVYDNRATSETFGQLEDLTIGRPDNYKLVRIPPMVWYGFTAISDTSAYIVNCTDIPHEPDESLRLPEDSDEIPFGW